ncbi:MAG: hypothetical protein AB1445_12600 [Bacillota bacterium]
MPAGYGPDGQPCGLTFTGAADSELVLIAAAYAFAQLTRHRVPPVL